MIRKKGGKYCLYSKKSGRNLGCSRTKAGARQREREVAYFKAHGNRRPGCDDVALAAFIDGEGFISIGSQVGEQSNVPRYQVRIGVANTNKDIIDYVAESAGVGSVSRAYRPKYPGAKDFWMWSAVSQEAKQVIERVLPHLIAKRQQAELALALQETIDQNRGKPMTDEEISYRETLRMELMGLNSGKGKARAFFTDRRPQQVRVRRHQRRLQ